jgi:hypothetical protein
MTKAEFLDLVRNGRAEWDALIAHIDEARMTEPGVEGEWSLKDILAHVTGYEREMADVLQARALVGSELWGLPLEARNAGVYEEIRNRPLPDVLSETRTVFQQLIAGLRALTDDDLNEASRFAEIPPDWKPWQVIASNTYEHYPDHIRAIRAWLEKSPTQT